MRDYQNRDQRGPQSQSQRGGRDHRSRNQPHKGYNLPPEVIEKGGKRLVEEAKNLSDILSRSDLGRSPIRKIYNTVKKIEWNGFEENQLVLLKPRLAYAAARNRALEELKNALTKAIDLVGNDEKKFKNFVDFFEATLAYHKAKSS